MRGVCFDKRGNGWIATYKNKSKGVKSIQKEFSVNKYPNAKELAVKQRKAWERLSELSKKGGPISDYTDKKIGNWKIIGATGKRENDRRLKWLGKNEITGEIKADTISDFKHNSGLGTRKNHGNRPKGASKKGKAYQTTIRINGRNYYLGRFPTAEEAHTAYMEALSNWKRLGKLPVKIIRNLPLNNTSGELNVYFNKANGKWLFNKVINHKRYYKRFSTKQEAINYKNKFMKEHN